MAKNSDQDDGNAGGDPDGYSVGNRRPPRDSQFRPGRSGNPAGRPRGSRNFLTALAAELKSTIAVQEGGRQKRIRKQDAVVKQLVARALKGDDRALARTIPLILQIDASTAEEGAKPLTGAERALLAAHAARLLKTIAEGDES